MNSLLEEIATTQIPELALDASSTKEDVERALSQICSNPIVYSNWEMAPLDVSASWRLGAGQDGFYLSFEVNEPTIRAEHSGDESPVCCDSCVEWFVSVREHEYFNFEFNPIGAICVGQGKDRNQREFLRFAQLPGLKFWGTEGQEPFQEREAQAPWKAWIKIPYELLGTDLKGLKEQGFKCNFYKCGDHLSRPHHLSWKPIETPEPDFHRPEFFKTLHIQ